jgi:hypothetical protein
MEAAIEGIRRGEEGEWSGEDGVVPLGMAPAAIAMPPELIAGNRVGTGGWVSLLPTATAVAGRPLLSVKVMFDPVGSRLTKKIERAAGRRGLHGDLPDSGNICGDTPTSGKICRVPAARGGSGGGRELLHTVKVTKPAAVAAMEGFTAARFPASSSEIWAQTCSSGRR